MRSINKLVSLTALSFIVSCGVNKDTEDASEQDKEETQVGTIEDISPADSTGTQAEVSLAFGASNALSLLLNEDVEAPESAASVKIGDSIELTYAKFNIAKIKVKAEKTQRQDEEKLEQEEIENESTAAAEVQVLTESEDVSAGLNAKPDETGKKQQSKKQAVLAKIKDHRAELKEKEKSVIEKEAKSDKSTKFSGPYIFDAILGKIEGEAPAVNVMDGTYKRVEFQLKRDFDSAEGEALLGNVFAMQGTVMKDGVAVPFVIDWHIALNFRIAGDQGLKISAGEDNAMIIDFNLATWFDGVDFTSADVEDGKIYVNKTSNQALMKQIHKNIKKSSGFGKDKNKDGKINSDEVAGQGQETTDASAL